MRRQIVMDGDFTSSCFIQDIHFNSVAECGIAISNDVGHIFQIGAVSDNVVGDVVADMFDHTVVSDYHVVKCGVEDAAVFLDASCQGEDFSEGSKLDLS